MNMLSSIVHRIVRKCWSVNSNSDLSLCNFANCQKEITKYQNDYNNKPA